MILRDDSLLELKTLEEKVARIKKMEDFLMKKYGVANREDAISSEELDKENYLSFNFDPYGIESINLYKGFWDIETAWGYGQYFDREGGPSVLQRDFFDMAQDFGCSDAYICSEFCTWNGGDVEHLTFTEWLEEMQSRYGEIQEITPEVDYWNSDERPFPQVFHDSFTALKDEMTQLADKVSKLGYQANGISSVGWYFITVSKDGKVYLMNKVTFELLIPGPIDYFMDLNCSSFEIVSGGKNMLFTSDGHKIFETGKGHFFWEWDSESGHPGFYNICVFNSKSGQAVLVVTEEEKNKDTDEREAFQVYYRKDNDKLIHRAKY